MESRPISIGDLEMRHPRKSETERIDGYEEYLARDLDNDLTLAAGVLLANAPQAQGADKRRPRVPVHGEVSERLIDRAFFASTWVSDLARERLDAAICRLRVARNGDVFTKSELHRANTSRDHARTLMRCRLVLWCALAVTTSCGEYFSPTETKRISADGSPIFFACLPERFEDRSAKGADRVVVFGVAPTPFVYRPKCMRIAAGQSVTFRGAFGIHPLNPGAGPTARMAGSPGNPIPETSTGMSIDVRFMVPGIYPYFCSQHAAAGMAGVIEVRP